MAHIILASTSPRRIDLLRQAGLSPQIIPPDADESILRGEAPRAMVARLAKDKAEAVCAKLLAAKGGKLVPNSIIIAADTTVVAPDGRKILGKPRDAREAARMLNTLMGETHTVLTGYCLLKINTLTFVRVVKSKVTLRKLSKRDIAKYVATGEPMDKAGAYAAQGIGMSFIERINGSYANVVGLPICQVMIDLEEKFGVSIL